MAEPTTTTKRDAQALDAEVAQLRTQASALHALRAEATRSSDSRWGGLRDDAARDADAARHASARAAEQANQQHKSANDFQQNVRAYETTANELAAAGNHERAAELREEAQAQRALAVAADERAARAHKAAADQAARADKLDQEVRDHDKRITGAGDERTPAIELVADQLDEKANLLAQAADSQRSAARFEAEGNAQAAARATQSAADTLAKADAMQPSFTSIDPVVLYDAGITPWPGPLGEDTRPGSEPITPEPQQPAPAGDGERGSETIDPSETLNPFDSSSDATGVLSADDAMVDPAEGTIGDRGPTEGNDETLAYAPAGLDQAPTAPTFDDPIGVDDGFRDFAPADDPTDAVAADDMSLEFES